KLAIQVLELRPGQIVLLGVSVLYVADGILELANICGNTFVALATLTGGPFYSLAFTDLFFPGGRNLGQIVGPSERGARTIRAMNDDDRSTRQIQVGVHGLDGLVVPLGDLAHKDIRQYLA